MTKLDSHTTQPASCFKKDSRRCCLSAQSVMGFSIRYSTDVFPRSSLPSAKLPSLRRLIRAKLGCGLERRVDVDLASAPYSSVQAFGRSAETPTSSPSTALCLSVRPHSDPFLLTRRLECKYQGLWNPSDRHYLSFR